jgi:hypothetical protein
MDKDVQILAHILYNVGFLALSSSEASIWVKTSRVMALLTSAALSWPMNSATDADR